MTRWHLRGDESFDSGNLNATAQTWHTRLMAEDITTYAIYSAIPSATDDAAGVELLGETARYNILPLITAFRLTGDLAILDIADLLMEQMVTPLITNGYIVGVGHMGQAGLSATLQQMAWVYTLNSGLSSPSVPAVDYAARATQWIDYLTNVYEPVWLPFADNYNLRHRSSATLHAQYYHWRRTGTATSWYDPLGWSGLWDQGYIAYRDYHFAENRQDLNPASVSAIGQQLVYDDVVGWRYIFDHGCLFPWQPTVPAYGWQETNYAAYTLANFVDLALEGIYPFGNTIMTRYANTAAWVMQDAGEAGLIRDSVNDNTFDKGLDTADLQTTRWGVVPFLGRWNSDLLQWGDVGWALAAKKIPLASWMLAATV